MLNSTKRQLPGFDPDADSKTFKIFGPPGTGKTTRLIKIVEKQLRLGVLPHEMVYVSFTNKAIDEAVDRVLKKFKQYNEDDFNNFRTIHSFVKKNYLHYLC